MENTNSVVSNNTPTENLTCEQCLKTFRKKSKLNRHIKEIHLNIKDYTCNICKKSFKRNSHLKRHLTIHSEDPKPFKCLYSNCLMRFSDKYHLERHVRVKHKNINFSCENCNLSFEKKLFLYKHNFQSHHLDKPFKCEQDDCGKSYYTKGILAKHLKHHEQPFLKKTKNSLYQTNNENIMWESNNNSPDEEENELIYEKKLDLSNIIQEGEIEIKKNFDDYANDVLNIKETNNSDNDTIFINNDSMHEKSGGLDMKKEINTKEESIYERKIDLSNIIQEGEIEIKNFFDELPREFLTVKKTYNENGEDICVNDNKVHENDKKSEVKSKTKEKKKGRICKKQIIDNKYIINKDEKYLYACAEENCGKSYSTVYYIYFYFNNSNNNNNAFF